ncbi:Protein FAR-RED ELONGATED HYPOCOTYL 3 [Bienertia sinuspersici]
MMTEGRRRLNQPLWGSYSHVTRGLKVTVDMEKHEFTCSCRMFEHKGILCRHCIRAMEMTNIATVSEKYVLNRWRKDVKRKHIDVKKRSLKSWSSSNLEWGLKVAKMILSLACKYQVPLQFDVHRPLRPDFQWAINEQQHSQGSSTVISSAASSAFRPLHRGSFSNWWTYGVGGTSATSSSSPFTPPPSQFGSGSSTMHGVCTASNGQPILLPQPLSRAVTSFLPPRPS